ncbi:MAG TPA: hypothetical protein VGS97_17500 [Actinocrinis sp.]|nr:hypothetical protein [Actinocrinis sp.]
MKAPARFSSSGIESSQVKALGFDRKETLLRVYRSGSDCVFKLMLSIDRDDYRPGISFSEFYDYLPRRGDAGREYAYGVRTGLSSLGRLVRFFDTRPGEPASPFDDKLTGPDDDAHGGYAPGHHLEHLEDRLVHHFRQLVARGELGDALPLRENRDRVLAWFNEAEVPAEPDDWSWIDS